MTVKISTEYKTDAKGGRITAKGKGKQRTIAVDPRYTLDSNHYLAASALGNVILDAEQQSKIHHPSGRQRVRFEGDTDKKVITLDV